MMDKLEAIKVPCHIRFGEKELTIKELGEIKVGQVITLNQWADEELELFIGKQIKEKGRLIKKDGKKFFIKKDDTCE